MKKITLYFISFVFFLACKQGNQSNESITVSIEKIMMDSTSIRAIEIVSDSILVYAGSRGDFGVISPSGKLKVPKNIVLDTIIPHFRSLAFTKQAFYALSVGNPALLFRFQNNKVEIAYKEEHEKVFYDAMKFFDELNGIAIGDPTEGCMSIIITRNGGKSWGKINCDDLPASFEGEAAFAASNTNIAIVGKNAWVVTGGLKARVFHTADMGITWNVYETPIIQGKNTTGIYTVDFYSATEGIICGGDYTDKFGESANKAITNDGGKTWEIVAKNLPPKYVSCVQYVPNTDGKEIIAVSTNGIFYSKDSGRQWDKVSDEGFYSVRMATKNTAWLSGDNVIAKMIIN